MKYGRLFYTLLITHYKDVVCKEMTDAQFCYKKQLNYFGVCRARKITHGMGYTFTCSVHKMYLS